MREGNIFIIEPEHIQLGKSIERLERSEDYIRSLIAVVQALVPMGADCGLPSLLAEIQEFLDQ